MPALPVQQHVDSTSRLLPNKTTRVHFAPAQSRLVSRANDQEESQETWRGQLFATHSELPGWSVASNAFPLLSFPNIPHARNVLEVGVLRPERSVVCLSRRQHHAVRHGQLES